MVHLATTTMSLDWLLRPQLVAFADAGYEVIAMSAPGPHVHALREAGIAHVPIPSLTRSMALGRDLRALAELVAAFRRLRPDIVHTHNPKPGVMGRLAARLAGVPAVVNTVHGLYATADDLWAKRTAVYGIERLATAFSDAELFQNPEDLSVMRALRVADRKLSVLGNGVDLRRFDPARVTSVDRRRIRHGLGLASDTVAVGAVGRLVWEKGYRELFAAAKSLAGENLRVFVVGPDDHDKAGAVDDESRRAAEQSGVVFLGARSDMVDLYSAFDVYVLASHREGFPRSAMEAAAMGLPIVATDVRGCRQVVDDGVTGTLVPPGDADALTSAVDTLVVNGPRRAAMGVAAREKARRHFDDRRVIDTTLRTYADVLPAAAPRVLATASV